MPVIQVNGLDTYYEITGSGEPIIFIHGLGSSTRDWEHQVEFFSKKYQVITYDLRGHGKTGKAAGPYTIELFARDAAFLIKALGIGPAHIAGISLGGMITYQLAVDEPQLFKSTIITNCLASTIAKTLRMRFELMKRKMLFKIVPFKKLKRALTAWKVEMLRLSSTSADGLLRIKIEQISTMALFDLGDRIMRELAKRQRNAPVVVDMTDDSD